MQISNFADILYIRVDLVLRNLDIISILIFSTVCYVFFLKIALPERKYLQTFPFSQTVLLFERFLLFYFIAIQGKSSLKYYEAQSIIGQKNSPINNICSNMYVYLYYSKLKPTLFFLHCLLLNSLLQIKHQANVLTTQATVQLLSLSAVPNIISAFDQGSRQGKLLCLRCLQNAICSFLLYYYFKLICTKIRLSLCVWF